MTVIDSPQGASIEVRERRDNYAKFVIEPLERGYGITAVERISGPPYSIVSHYPDGWPTVVTGPHIRHWHCPKPQWLAEYEGDLPPEAAAARKKKSADSF